MYIMAPDSIQSNGSSLKGCQAGDIDRWQEHLEQHGNGEKVTTQVPFYVGRAQQVHEGGS